ncbi:unnamed protein product [Rotaria sordida]|uniref:F-box domain-containing protein n=1 Tax=Rotaria sordida TaxID=392033 RepID=A0A814U0W7_9BILA|nr:unnamed protein product [Rotaria sordida]CAF1419214.1 unnamed protein product [Rotaria sordida]
MKFELLPNEIFIKCFRYLNALDIFYSFDRLNYRFYKLIRNISLHLDFQQLKKSKFNQFCQIILSNAEIKYNVISLKLSNDGTRGQIENFLSAFALNEFINLQSLSLMNLKNDDLQKLLPILPLLSKLYCFSFTRSTRWDDKTSEILPALKKSKLRILSIPSLSCDRSIFKQMSITSLTISSGYLPKLCELFQYASMLKCFTKKAVNLKRLIIDYSMAEFETLEHLLKRIPNLTIFTINAPYKIDMIDADRWQYLIESSLLHLRVFNFYFSFSDKLYFVHDKKLQQFRTDFWSKQHWYTNNERCYYQSISIYTMPYAWNEYRLIDTWHTYNNLNGFDNVTKLTLETVGIKDNLPFYFKSIKSLIFVEPDIDDGYEPEEWLLQPTQIEFLNKMVNLSNIKHLEIPSASCTLSSSLLLEILKILPYISSLEIDKRSLILFLDDHELRKYLNRKIHVLHITSGVLNDHLEFDEIDLFSETFSNVEKFHCHIKQLDVLLLILRKFAKLSILSIQNINKDMYSWIQMNASNLNALSVIGTISAIYENGISNSTQGTQGGVRIGQSLISVLFYGFGIFVAYRHSETGLKVVSFHL